MSNRNKQSIQLNLRKENDLKFLLEAIIPSIDVIMESYRPGTLEKLGVSPTKVHSINPKIIYVRLTGYG